MTLCKGWYTVQGDESEIFCVIKEEKSSLVLGSTSWQ